MKKNSEFINQLREEIHYNQKTREALTIAKLSFLTGLLSAGVILLTQNNSPKNTLMTIPITTYYLLYYAPIITFIFDFYILRQNFRIKRAGIFIKTSNIAPSEEILWETIINKTSLLKFLTGTTPTLLLISFTGITLYLFSNIGNKIIFYYGGFTVVCILLHTLCRLYYKRNARRLENDLEKENRTIVD